MPKFASVNTGCCRVQFVCLFVFFTTSPSCGFGMFEFQRTCLHNGSDQVIGKRREAFLNVMSGKYRLILF